MTAFSTQLVAGTDQARTGIEENGTTWSVGSQLLYIGNQNGSQYRIGGLVFVLDVPQGVTIDDATLTLTNYANGFGTPTFTAYADAALTQANFSIVVLRR